METSKFKQYWNDPFAFMDNLDLTFKGNQLNLFLKYKRLRKTAFVMAIVALVCWMVFGFDSTPIQFIILFYNLPNLITGQLNYNQWVGIYHQFYGKEMHYSAFVIYGLMYWALSRHLEKNLGVTKSRNIAYASSLTLFAIAIFEFYWIYSYAYFQNQWWVASWKLPQLRILLQNVIFFSVGLLCILYFWADSYILKGKEIIGRKYKFNWNKTSLVLLFISVATAIFWWTYPFYVEKFDVRYDDGYLWSNSQNFPQTLYTIDVNRTDNLNAGVWFFKENNAIHGWNTLVKAVWTLAVFQIALLKPVGEEQR